MRTMRSTGRSGARRPRVGAALVVAASAALLLAACGSSTAKTSSSGAASPSTSAPTPSSEAVKPIAMTASSTLGNVLVDSKGMTLYTLTKDGKAVPCTGQCLTFWPPLLLPTGDSKPVAPGISNLAIAMTSAGKEVSYKGLPLHTFVMDKAPGQTNGEGINTFGGTWHVVKLTSTTSPAGAVPATTTPTTSSGGGYGY